ncbi:MAG: 6-phosphofructokinase [Acidobacteria bacterium]|nr:6-phosphofructokinase [Acidobacteriota bacterium]
MRRIAVLLTSGGDAPGMNAAIRAVTRTALDREIEVFGVRQGFAGLIAGHFVPLNARSVGGIIQHAGTMLGSTRCLDFKTEEGQSNALRQLARHNVDGLVVIGGNGTQSGSYALSRKGFPVIGIASTIDNDLCGTEITIGVDTALNVALEAIGRLKVTAASHQRAFLVEVMGRDCGYIALMTGIAGGAESIVIPEIPSDPEGVAQELRAAYERGKPHAIVVVAEGAKYNAEGLASYFKLNRERLGFDLRVTILGHVQRGGAPGIFDRLLGTRFGAAATESLATGEHGVLIGIQNGRISRTPLSEIAGKTKELDVSLFELARVLAK